MRNMRRMMVIPSKSRYELTLERFGSEDASRRHFGQTEVWDYIISSHHAQRESLGVIKRACEEYATPFIDRSRLTQDIIGEYDTFVFAGGDNHFTYCAQEILQYQREYPGERKDVIGVILDSTKSLGALLQTDPEGFIDAIPRLLRGEYATGAWTTLEATVRADGIVRRPHPALGEYFIGERDRMDMSRNKTYLNGTPVLLEKGSGILVVTGAGAGEGSWYDNNHAVLYGASDGLVREALEAHAIVTENKQAVDPSRGKAVLHPEDSLMVFSYNDADGVLCPDAHREHSVPFMIGAKAEVRVGEHPLSVILP